jgi:hypothetical protein
VSQAAVAVIQFLRTPLLAVPAHRREQIAEQANRLAAPIALTILAILAYKFWA